MQATSGHAPHRLARNLKGRFGDHAYAAERLVAELGAHFLCAQHEIDARATEDCIDNLVRQQLGDFVGQPPAGGAGASRGSPYGLTPLTTGIPGRRVQVLR